MKNFSKTISAIGMSLLAVGAFAQVPAYLTPKQTPVTRVITKSVMNPRQVTHSVTSAPINGILDYVDGDANNMGWTFGTNYTGWFPTLYMNARYTAKDTVTSPLTSNKANAYTANSVTVVYDTLWDNDLFLTTGLGFTQPQAGSLSIDTIWTLLGYHNTSGKNDTLILTVSGVTAAGFYSAAPVIEIDTEIIAPHTSGVLPGTSLDSTYQVGFIPKHGTITIPGATTHAGWHFCITATVYGSKQDTLGITYYSALTVCSGNNYNDTTTSMGPLNGNPHRSNSFVTGLYWYNSRDFHGTGAQITFPLTSGANAGKWINSGGQQFYGFDPASCGFIWYPYIQNIGILCSVNYKIKVGGVNELTANGLSVKQNYPNPFNKETTISYSVTKSSDVTFTVYDITGRVITNNSYGNVAPGQYSINLSANTFSPGIYFYTFNVNGSTVTKKMVITQ